jgi:heme/copper-type cytochrome/quinol oxidase subunit 2
MNVDLIIFLITFALFLPLAGALLYVWWKYGKEEKAVGVARIVFLVGTVFLFSWMLIL